MMVDSDSKRANMSVGANQLRQLNRTPVDRQWQLNDDGCVGGGLWLLWSTVVAVWLIPDLKLEGYWIFDKAIAICISCGSIGKQLWQFSSSVVEVMVTNVLI